MKRKKHQRFKNLNGSVLFERRFKERIWASILDQLTTASKGGAYWTATAFRIHTFQHPQWKKGGLRQNETPKEDGPSHSTLDPAVTSTNTRNTQHPTQWMHSHASLFPRLFSLKGHLTCSDRSAGVPAPVRRSRQLRGSPKLPSQAQPAAAAPELPPPAGNPYSQRLAGGAANQRAAGRCPAPGSARPPRTDPLKKTPVAGGGRSEELLR